MTNPVFGTCGFTPEEAKRIQEALAAALPKEAIKQRKGQGGQVKYVEGGYVLETMNKIFTPTGWATEIKDLKSMVCKQRGNKFHESHSCIVRVTLKDGCYREDVGCGDMINPCEASAAQMSMKSAATDAIKRACRQFGPALGGTLYDKEETKAVLRGDRAGSQNGQNGKAPAYAPGLAEKGRAAKRTSSVQIGNQGCIEGQKRQQQHLETEGQCHSGTTTLDASLQTCATTTEEVYDDELSDAALMGVPLSQGALHNNKRPRHNPRQS